jgi:hypothetical protein
MTEQRTSDNLPERYGEVQQAFDFFERASTALATLEDPIEVAQFLKQAEAVEYLTRTMNAAKDVQRQAAEVVLRTKRRLGELLVKTDLPKGGRPPKNRLPGEPVSPTLSDLGITKRESSEAQKIAFVPEPEFERYASESPRPTASGLIDAESKLAEPPKTNVARSRTEEFNTARARITPEQYLMTATATEGILIELHASGKCSRCKRPFDKESSIVRAGLAFAHAVCPSGAKTR